MTCREVRGLAPLFLSGEMRGEARQRVAAHLAECPGCEREFEQQALVDARVARAVSRESPDTARIEQAVRRHIAYEPSRRRWMAAAVIAALAGSYGLWRLVTPPEWCADAARDHRVEVVQRQPRRWRSDTAEIGTVAAQNGLTLEQAASLAANGYRLERAKICGIDGQRMLHLVFTDGTRSYSVYVRPHPSAGAGVRVVRRGAEQVAGFETGRFQAIVVTDGPEAECEALARQAALRL